MGLVAQNNLSSLFKASSEHVSRRDPLHYDQGCNGTPTDKAENYLKY